MGAYLAPMTAPTEDPTKAKDAAPVVRAHRTWRERETCWECGEYLGDREGAPCFVLDKPDLDLPFCSEACAVNYAHMLEDHADDEARQTR
jgi:hypothetical protein